MCIAIPYKVLSVEGFQGEVERAGKVRTVDMTLINDAREGDWVLVFINQAIRRVDPEELPLLEAAIAGLEGVLNGTATQADIDHAMQGLGTGEPELPDHLKALVGKKTLKD